jgi:hypothetical protein
LCHPLYQFRRLGGRRRSWHEPQSLRGHGTILRGGRTSLCGHGGWGGTSKSRQGGRKPGGASIAGMQLGNSLSHNAKHCMGLMMIAHSHTHIHSHSPTLNHKRSHSLTHTHTNAHTHTHRKTHVGTQHFQQTHDTTIKSPSSGGCGRALLALPRNEQHAHLTWNAANDSTNSRNASYAQQTRCRKVVVDGLFHRRGLNIFEKPHGEYIAHMITNGNHAQSHGDTG